MDEMAIEKFDINELRRKAHSQQQDSYVGGQRMSGDAAELLNMLDRLLNALALYQGEPDLVRELPPISMPVPPVNRHILAQLGFKEESAADSE